MMKLTLKGDRTVDVDYDLFVDETIVIIYDEEESLEELEEPRPILKEYGDVMLLLIEDGYVFNTATDRFESPYGYVIKDIIDYCGKEVPEQYIGMVPYKYLVDGE